MLLIENLTAGKKADRKRPTSESGTYQVLTPAFRFLLLLEAGLTFDLGLIYVGLINEVPCIVEQSDVSS